MANNPLKVAALPLAIRWADREANLQAVAQTLETLEPTTDVLALPELFSTGFIAEESLMRQLAEPDNGPTLARLRELSARHRIAIAGSFLGCNNERTEFYNRAFFIEPNGDTAYCNKRHLFHLSPEAKLLTAGKTSYITVRFRGWNIAVGVCYDLRYPVWCRNVNRHGTPAYDLFIFVANWPQARGYALDVLLRARAIENQAYVIGANRSGEDDYGKYDGLTYCNDFMGQTHSRSNLGEPVYLIADRAALEQYRHKMPAALDADTFTIEY